VQLRALHLPGEDGDLVSQGKELEIALGVRLAVNDHEFNGQAQQPIDGREDHE